MGELLPCPFCGKGPRIYYGDDLVRCSTNKCPLSQAFTDKEGACAGALESLDVGVRANPGF